MNRHGRVFMGLALSACLSVMALGFGLMLQPEPATQVLGFILTQGAFALGMGYFLALPRQRRQRALRRWEAREARWNTPAARLPDGTVDDCVYLGKSWYAHTVEDNEFWHSADGYAWLRIPDDKPTSATGEDG